MGKKILIGCAVIIGLLFASALVLVVLVGIGIETGHIPDVEIATGKTLTAKHREVAREAVPFAEDERLGSGPIEVAARVGGKKLHEYIRAKLGVMGSPLTAKQLERARPLDDELRRGACRYWMENVREAMVVPGQWYLDRRAGMLSYLPLAHERLGQVEMIAPCLDKLVCLEGTGNPEIMPVFSNPGWPKVTIEVPPSRPDILMSLEKVSTQAVHDLHFVGIDFSHVECE